MDIHRILDSLISEHEEFKRVLRRIEEEIREGVSQESIDLLIEFIKREVDEHSYKEEEILYELVGDKFNVDTIVFAHENIREKLREFEDLVEDFRKGEVEEEIVKGECLNLINMLMDHFLKEESILFPLIRGYDLNV